MKRNAHFMPMGTSGLEIKEFATLLEPLYLKGTIAHALCSNPLK